MTLAFELDGEVIGDLYLSRDGRVGAGRGRGPGEEDPGRDRLGRGSRARRARATPPRAPRELLRICFEDLGLRRVEALCFADNVASWRIMEKLGMRHEEYAVRDSLHRSRGWLDGMTYAILVDEWRAGRGRPDSADAPGPERRRLAGADRAADRSGRAARRPRGDVAVPRSSPGVGEWLTQAHDDRAEYEQRFRDPERMAMILVVERDGEIIGDQMLVIEDAWAQAEVADRAAGCRPRSAGSSIPTTPVRDTPPRRPPGSFGSASRVCGCAASWPSRFAENIRSWQLMERLGMRREQHGVRDSLHRSHGWQDTLRLRAARRRVAGAPALTHRPVADWAGKRAHGSGNFPAMCAIHWSTSDMRSYSTPLIRSSSRRASTNQTAVQGSS